MPFLASLWDATLEDHHHPSLLISKKQNSTLELDMTGDS
jgi:hypothetical protein